MTNTKGIVIAGNIIADIIKIIDSYPAPGMLSSILDHSHGVGGCVPNTAIDIAKIDQTVPIKAIGRVGDDANADYVLGMLSQNGVDIGGVKRIAGSVTSYSDVMTAKATGMRTFFHARGANAEFCQQDMGIDDLDCDIFHLGYALLLDQLDMPDSEYGTKMARVLAAVSQRGIKTSIDVVSENSDRFKTIVSPSLKYCDYVIINEIEASMISGVPLRDSADGLISKNLKAACQSFVDAGVREYVCIHFPEGAVMLSALTGEYCEVPSLILPPDSIKGSVGAGDAFCAGLLYSLYKGYTMELCLRYASCAAACCLTEFDSTSGLKDISVIKHMDKTYKRRSF